MQKLHINRPIWHALWSAALAALCASPSEAANVTLFGTAEPSLVLTHNAAGDALTMNSGFRHGSHVGIEGREILSSSLETGFLLDTGYDITSGEFTDGEPLFSREAILYLRGSLGEIGAGRFGTLSSGTGSYTALSGWAFGTTYTSAAWSEFGRTVPAYRINNALAYVSPAYAGTRAYFIYSNGFEDETGSFSDDGHYWGTALLFEGEQLTASVLFERADWLSRNANGTDAPAYAANAGLEYAFPAGTLYLGYQQTWQREGVRDRILGVSTRLPAAGGSVLAGVRGLIGRNGQEGLVSGARKRRTWSLHAAYEYPLSSRTTIWAYAGYADGGRGLSEHFEEGRKVNFNGRQTAVGLTHNF